MILAHFTKIVWTDDKENTLSRLLNTQEIYRIHNKAKKVECVFHNVQNTKIKNSWGIYLIHARYECTKYMNKA